MIKNTNSRSVITIISALSAIISTTILIIFIAQGHIPEYDNGLKIKITGILSATSLPKNANVIINDKLTTTTDDSVNLVPGDYQLKIVKDGYLPWNKKITIEPEMVYQAQASLFKTEPVLSQFIDVDIITSTVNTDFTKLAYISSPSTLTSKAYIYVVETDYISQILKRYQPKLITQNPFLASDKSVSLLFSPDSKQLLVKSVNKKLSYVINLVTNQITQQINTFNFIPLPVNLTKVPKIFLNQVATNPAQIQYSYTEDMFLYSFNSKYYVYDIEKNINHQIGNQQSIHNPFWLPNSNNIIYFDNNSIKSIEFDGTNENTIYQNVDGLKAIAPATDGKRIIIENLQTTKTYSNLFFLTIK